MKDLQSQKTKIKKGRTAKECAYVAVFVALVIALQVVFSAVPGVELVTVMFVSFSFAMGIRRGMISATCFSLLRQMIFGFFPKILILYFVYFNVLTLFFGIVGKSIKNKLKFLPIIVILACFCTVCFTMFDNILTPLWYGYSERATKLYFKASLPFMIPQVISTAVSTAVLFLPLSKIFQMLKRSL